jgi:phosphoglycerol transferase MdoB-like AlkP superfamily enzyme
MWQAQSNKAVTAVGVLITVAAAITADQLRPGWGRPVLLTVGVFAAMVGMWRQLWRKWWFWATLLPLLALQLIALVRFVAARNFIEHLHPLTLFVLFLVNVFSFALALGIAAQLAGRGERN